MEQCAQASRVITRKQSKIQNKVFLYQNSFIHNMTKCEWFFSISSMHLNVEYRYCFQTFYSKHWIFYEICFLYYLFYNVFIIILYLVDMYKLGVDSFVSKGLILFGV